jgi:hypothetical protein
MQKLFPIIDRKKPRKTLKSRRLRTSGPVGTALAGWLTLKNSMKTIIILTSAVVLLGGSSVGRAQEVTLTNSTQNPWAWDTSSPEKYHNYELTLEGFGVGTLNEHTLDHLTGDRIRRNGRLGFGAGAEFFFLKYIGIEGEGFSEGTTHDFVDSAGGNLVLRLPIGQSGFAPYIFGGGGHQFNPVDASYVDGGGGFEYRFTHWFGLFIDGRYVATVHTGNYGEGRLGVRINF